MIDRTGDRLNLSPTRHRDSPWLVLHQDGQPCNIKGSRRTISTTSTTTNNNQIDCGLPTSLSYSTYDWYYLSNCWLLLNLPKCPEKEKRPSSTICPMNVQGQNLLNTNGSMLNAPCSSLLAFLTRKLWNH
ncbi:0bd407d7-d45f-44a4-a78f-a152d6d94503 [Sclerotinia trifoliorum]|uniref:0bd407d7-d45f-44a4-a78f-a152d6d94503 n=1 Tax=Sclerotinia trifoliorum TaxID=28548 RepID=A0A8H2VRP2_9HELO|nr:0bd407d7-d45f-44a4-a78f-a152d6d94503 [Sclerotinia trifoliorum]